MLLSAPIEGTFQVQQRPIITQQQRQPGRMFPILHPPKDRRPSDCLPLPFLTGVSSVSLPEAASRLFSLGEGKPKNIPLKFLTIRSAGSHLAYGDLLPCRFSGMEGGGAAMNAFVSTLSAAQLPSVGENDLLPIPKANRPNLLPLKHRACLAKSYS